MSVKKQPVTCHQCGQQKLNQIDRCPYHTSQTCAYTITPLNLPFALLGRSWLDYLDFGVTAACFVVVELVIQLVSWALNSAIVFCSINLLLLIALFLYLGTAKTSLAWLFKPLGKKLEHYYAAARGQGFILYRRFGFTALYGRTAVTPIPFTLGDRQIGPYAPSLLALAQIAESEDFSEKLLGTSQIMPQLVRWTLLGLAAQDVIQLEHLQLTSQIAKNRPMNLRLAFIAPKAKLASYVPNGALENEFVAKLRPFLDQAQSGAFGAISVYELVYNLLARSTEHPVEKVVTQSAAAAIERGWAERTDTSELKEKVKSIFVLPWRLAPLHRTAILDERQTMAGWDNMFRYEQPNFAADLETAVAKAIDDRTIDMDINASD